jgi:hypothetical protein
MGLVYPQRRCKTFRTGRSLTVSGKLSSLIHVYENVNICLMISEYHPRFQQCFNEHNILKVIIGDLLQGKFNTFCP